MAETSEKAVELVRDSRAFLDRQPKPQNGPQNTLFASVTPETTPTNPTVTLKNR
jgi:hypothetical protein